MKQLIQTLTNALTQRVGETHTNTVHSRSNAGKEIKVLVSPKCRMTIPVPNNENKNEIEFVTYFIQLIIIHLLYYVYYIILYYIILYYIILYYIIHFYEKNNECILQA